MNVYFVRHGETDLNLQDRIQGQLDACGLNANGVAQVRALAETLRAAGARGDVVLSSPLRRARETAAAVAAAFGLPVALDNRLKEISCGDHEGQEIAKVRALRFDAPMIFRDALDGTDILAHTGAEMRDLFTSADPRHIHVAHPNGESKAAALARTEAAVFDCLEKHKDARDIWIVCHSLIIRQILSKYAPALTARKIGCAEVIRFSAGPRTLQNGAFWPA